VTECGTTGYMAPEMFRGFDMSKKGYDGTQSDVWACGVILFIMLAGFPPFQKPDKSDWWFHKLLVKKHNLFWQAHCRAAKFSETAKDLINKMLNPDPEKRITLREIQEHEWYRGTTISENNLYTEFAKRKQIVDQENRKLKLAKQQEQQNLNLSDRDMLVRDLDEVNLSDDCLPPCPPSIDLRLKSGEKVDVPLQTLSMGSLVLEDNEGCDPTIPVFDSLVASFTRFESPAAPKDILKRLRKVFGDLDAESAISESEGRFKVVIRGPTTSVTLIGQIYQHPATPSLSIVDFKKRQGDSVEYRQAYAQIRNRCDDICAAAQ